MDLAVRCSLYLQQSNPIRHLKRMRKELLIPVIGVAFVALGVHAPILPLAVMHTSKVMMQFSGRDGAAASLTLTFLAAFTFNRFPECAHPCSPFNLMAVFAVPPTARAVQTTLGE
jgi:hypothetical protein